MTGDVQDIEKRMLLGELDRLEMRMRAVMAENDPKSDRWRIADDMLQQSASIRRAARAGNPWGAAFEAVVLSRVLIEETIEPRRRGGQNRGPRNLTRRRLGRYLPEYRRRVDDEKQLIQEARRAVVKLSEKEGTKPDADKKMIIDMDWAERHLK